MPTDGRHASEDDHACGQFTDKVSEGLDESEIKERDDSLGENKRDGVNGNWKRKDGDAILPLWKPTCWSAQDFDDQHGPFPRGGEALTYSFR
jgi:hypothetical protein